MDTEDGLLAADEQELLEAEFSLKKKKKKTKKKSENADESKPETGDGENAEKAADGAQGAENNENNNVNVFDPPSYEYVQLLNRVVDCIHQNNPELADKKRFTMKPPQLMRGM